MRVGVACLLLVLGALLLACGSEEELAPLPTDSLTPEATGAPTPSPDPSPQRPGLSPTESAMATDWAALIQGVADHLTANSGSADCLAGLFASWNMPSDGTPSCTAADLDGDGENEYVVRLVLNSAERASYSGDSLAGKVLIFDRNQLAWVPVFNLEDVDPFGFECLSPPKCRERAFSNPVIYGTHDLTGDGTLELILTTGHCGAHTCFLVLWILSNRNGAYVRLPTSPEGSGGLTEVPLTDDQLRIEDIDGDGLPELILRQGTIASAGAGPQRDAVRTYKWDSEKFALTGFQYDSPNYEGFSLFFLIRDGNDSFSQARYAEAHARYGEALSQPDLTTVYSTASSVELRAYARFRIGLALAAMGDARARWLHWIRRWQPIRRLCTADLRCAFVMPTLPTQT